MQTMQLDNGALNIYAAETQMYLATFPAPEQQRRYMLQAGFASLLITALTLIAISVS